MLPSIPEEVKGLGDGPAATALKEEFPKAPHTRYVDKVEEVPKETIKPLVPDTSMQFLIGVSAYLLDSLKFDRSWIRYLADLYCYPREEP